MTAMLSELAREYLESYPQEAAALLEAADIGASGATLTALETPLRAALLERMTPFGAARCLGALEAGSAADIVERLPVGLASAIMTHLPEGARQAVLAEVKPAVSRAVRRLMRYPDDTVGAVMVADAVTLRSGAALAEATALAKRESARLLPVVFVLNDRQTPVGMVDVRDLLTAPPSADLHALTRPPPAVLRAHASVEASAWDPIWSETDFRPVIDADHRFVGVLPKSRILERLLGARSAPRDGDPLIETVMALADLVWTPAAELLAQASAQSLSGEHDDER
jgi:magnesium transporter